MLEVGGKTTRLVAKRFASPWLLHSVGLKDISENLSGKEPHAKRDRAEQEHEEGDAASSAAAARGEPARKRSRGEGGEEEGVPETRALSSSSPCWEEARTPAAQGEAATQKCSMGIPSCRKKAPALSGREVLDGGKPSQEPHEDSLSFQEDNETPSGKPEALLN